MNRLLKDLEFKVYTTPLEKAGHSGERRLIRGYASVGDVLDRQNEVITLGALIKAREDLLKNHTIFYEHKHSELPIGKTISVDIDEKGLLITVEISKGSHADSVWTLIQEGILNSFSIGGRVLEAEEKRDKQGNLFNEITQIELFETSVVGLPANPAAKFELISKSFGMAITEELRKKREVSNKMAKENKETEKEVEVKEITEKTVDKKEEVTKSEETKEKIVAKSEEKKEVNKNKEVEKSEEKKEEVSKEKEVEKSEEVDETREDKKSRLLKEIEDIEVEEEAEKEANAKISTEKSEEKEEVVEETSLEEASSKKSEETEEVIEEEKTIDEKILEKLSLIIEKFDSKKEVEKTEEKETPTEEVETEAPAEERELAVAKSEKTSEKTEEKDLDKVIKIEDIPKETEKVSKEKETPTRKGEVIIAETPYSSQDDDNTIDKATLQKVKDLSWCKYIFGNK